MKRDMDLVRNILLAIEADPTGYPPEELEIEGYTKDQIGYHMLIMIEAGLLEGQEVTPMGASCPVGIPTRMTWHGHEFLDACRDVTRWSEPPRSKLRGIKNQNLAVVVAGTLCTGG